MKDYQKAREFSNSYPTGKLEEKTTQTNTFPFEVLPNWLQKEIDVYGKYNVIYKPMLSTFILNVMGNLLSDFYEVRVNGNWVIRPNIWNIGIGVTGSGKSHQLEIANSPLKKRNQKLKEIYDRENSIYSNLKFKLSEVSKAERTTEYVKTVFKEVYGENYKPKLKLYIDGGITKLEPIQIKRGVENFTFEGILNDLAVLNGVSYMHCYDEIEGLFNGFNRFTKSDDEQSFLKMFDYGSFDKTRADSKASLSFNDRTYSVMGTTQPERLSNIFKDERIDNGNIFRFLFVNDERNESEFDNTQIDYNDGSIKYFENYNKFCEKYMVFDLEINRYKHNITKDVFYFAEEFIKEFKKERRSNGDYKINAIEGKLKYYLYKFAIIINRAYAFEHTNINNIISDVNFTITTDDIYKASKLFIFYYFEIQNLLTNNIGGVSEILKSNEEIELFYDMADEFTVSGWATQFEALTGLGGRTAKRRLEQLVDARYLYKRGTKYIKSK